MTDKEKPTPEPKKRVMAEIFEIGGEYDFKYEYLNSNEGLALIAMLDQVKSRVRTALFGANNG